MLTPKYIYPTGDILSTYMQLQMIWHMMITIGQYSLGKTLTPLATKVIGALIQVNIDFLTDFHLKLMFFPLKCIGWYVYSASMLFALSR